MDETGVYAYTIDNQWLPDAEYDDIEYTFNAVRIEDDTAYLLGETTLPEYYQSFMIADGLAYIGGYSWLYYDGGMIIIDLSDPENLEQHNTDLPEFVTTILGAKDRTAFFRMWNGIGCYDVEDPASPELTDYKYGNAYNNRVAFSGDKSYLPMGYFGLWIKEMTP
jgi:hypothetical protein